MRLFAWVVALAACLMLPSVAGAHGGGGGGGGGGGHGGGGFGGGGFGGGHGGFGGYGGYGGGGHYGGYGGGYGGYGGMRGGNMGGQSMGAARGTTNMGNMGAGGMRGGNLANGAARGNSFFSGSKSPFAGTNANFAHNGMNGMNGMHNNWNHGWNHPWNNGGYGGYGGYGGFGFYPFFGYGLGYGLFGYGLGYGYGGYGGYGYGGYGYGYPYGYGNYGYANYNAQTAVAQQPPTSGVDFSSQGEAEFKAGKYQDAVHSWRHALLDQPNGGIVLLTSQALFALGQYNEAAGALEAGLSMLPQDKWNGVVANYTQLYGNIGDYTTQLKALEKARDAKPDDPAIRVLLGYHFGYLGYPKEAVRELDKAIALQPKDPFAAQLRNVFGARWVWNRSPCPRCRK